VCVRGGLIYIDFFLHFPCNFFTSKINEEGESSVNLFLVLYLCALKMIGKKKRSVIHYSSMHVCVYIYTSV